MRAYAYRSGHIGFAGETCPIPDGAMVIAHAPKKVLEPVVRGLARLAYDNETYLVPGCPEASDDTVALKAFSAFAERVRAAIGRQSARRLPARNELERESGRRDGE